MIKLITLIIACIILFSVFILLLIFTFIKKTKRYFILSIVSFFLLFSTGIYTIFFGLKKGKEKTGEIARTGLQKIFPTFDSKAPDTEANKKNFRNFLKVDLTPDVQNIYCFDDAIGQDSDYMFAFSCDSVTARKIIERHELKNDHIFGNNPDGLQHEFFWWDINRINELQRYSWDSDTDRKNLHKLFWYDEKNKKAYYFEYSM